ncbi:hypothetical protein Taro_023257 [Colocasia esculenta]|uniref:Uncharacterized protein n=1 Tax=Colocasia esculenta TaxID=4460 RepID=A0A843V3D7_COLES|nr:hypothetical protein [Colocasia esculenta]
MRLLQPIRALVSTLPDLVSTHCPKTAQRVFWKGFETEFDQTPNIKVLLLVVLVIFHVERFV